MKKKNTLIYPLTAGWALLTVGLGLYFLLGGMAPTADVKARAHARIHAVPIENWKPGEVKTLRIREKPVVVWRRNLDEIATAMAQVDTSLSYEDWAEVLNDGSLARELGPDAFARLEWLIISPVTPRKWGCIVHTKSGDYGGFFDPCIGIHFDMWGRPQKGPTDQSLAAQRPQFSEDGQFVLIDLSKLP